MPLGVYSWWFIAVAQPRPRVGGGGENSFAQTHVLWLRGCPAPLAPDSGSRHPLVASKPLPHPDSTSLETWLDQAPALSSLIAPASYAVKSPGCKHVPGEPLVTKGHEGRFLFPSLCSLFLCLSGLHFSILKPLSVVSASHLLAFHLPVSVCVFLYTSVSPSVSVHLSDSPPHPHLFVCHPDSTLVTTGTKDWQQVCVGEDGVSVRLVGPPAPNPHLHLTLIFSGVLFPLFPAKP